MTGYYILWNGPQAQIMNPETSQYFTAWIKRDILDDPEYKSKSKDILKGTLPMISETLGITIQLADGKCRTLEISNALRAKIEKIFNGTANPLDPTKETKKLTPEQEVEKEIEEETQKRNERVKRLFEVNNPQKPAEARDDKHQQDPNIKKAPEEDVPKSKVLPTKPLTKDKKEAIRQSILSKKEQKKSKHIDQSEKKQVLNGASGDGEKISPRKRKRSPVKLEKRSGDESFSTAETRI